MDITFSCDKCGQAMTIDSQYAGMNTNCIACDAEVTIPAENTPPAPPPNQFGAPGSTPPPPPKNEKKFCPKCSSQLGAPTDVICINCGFNLKGGKNIKAKQQEQEYTGRKFPFAVSLLIAVGAMAVLAGIWGWLSIAFETPLHLALILIGLAAGGIIRLLTYDRSFKAGLLAILLTLFGIVFAKVIYVEHQARQFTSKVSESFGEGFADGIISDSALEEQMLAKGELPDPYADFARLIEEKAPAADPRYQAALEKIDQVTEENSDKVEEKMEKLTDEEKAQLKVRFTESLQLGMLYAQLEGAGELQKMHEIEIFPDAATASSIEYRKKMAENQLILRANNKKVKERYDSMPEEERAKFDKTMNRMKTGGSILLGVAARIGFFIASFWLLGFLFFFFALWDAWWVATKVTES